MSCASTWRRRSLLHAFVLATVVALTLSARTHAQPIDPSPIQISPGFQELVDLAPDTVGTPLADERGGDTEDSTIVVTTTGLLYWEPGLRASWTNGYDRLTLDGVQQIVQWVGALLKPPPIEVFGFTFGSGDWIERRTYCIEGIESHHSSEPRWQYNPTDINGVLNGPGEHAQGWLGWLPSTARYWGATIGNRPSEWAAARRMISSQPEHFLRGQFAGIGWGVC